MQLDRKVQMKTMPDSAHKCLCAGGPLSHGRCNDPNCKCNHERTFQERRNFALDTGLDTPEEKYRRVRRGSRVILVRIRKRRR